MSETSTDQHPPTDPAPAAGTADATDGGDPCGTEHGGAAEVTALDELTHEPQPLIWAATGAPVGATMQLVPPYERRVMTTASGVLVTGVRVALDTRPAGRLYVDLAAARTRMASVWDDRYTAPVALLRYAGVDDETCAETDTGPDGHLGLVEVAADPFDYLYGTNPTTDRYPNLETALVDIARRVTI